MAGEVLLYPPPPPHLLSLLYPALWFNTEQRPPTLASFTSFVIIFCPNIGGRGSSEVSPLEGWEAVGSCYYPGAGWPRRGHRPLPRFQWHFHSLSLCNNISHAALSFTINLCWSYFQSKGTHKAKKWLFLRVSPCTQCKRASVYFHLLNLPKIAVNIRPRIPTQREEKGKGGRKKDESIKINSVLPHSFSDKQQLHRIGNKYYLCDKKNNTARFSRVVHKAWMLRVITSTLARFWN